MDHIAQAVDPFVFRLSIFVLAVFVGYFVVWSVTPALHTPLMSVTNAISSVIVVAALLYLVAGVLFILSLRGLSSPASSRRGNFLGMGGMAIAVATTLAAHPPANGIGWVLVVLGVAIGGSIGAVIARRVPMTSMPELVAAFHSLVGMAAVLVAAGAFYAPEAFDIGTPGHIHPQSLVEMSLGVAIVALTVTGAGIAFLQLSGPMSGTPIILPARAVITIALRASLVAFIVRLVISGSALGFWLITLPALVPGSLLIIPIPS